MKRAIVVFVGLLTVILFPMVATAHNAGHLFLPDGRCLEIGSFREAPVVGPDGTPLDLVPETPQDEYGVSFVGHNGQTPIFPRPLPGGTPAQVSATAQRFRSRRGSVPKEIGIGVSL